MKPIAPRTGAKVLACAIFGKALSAASGDTEKAREYMDFRPLVKPGTSFVGMTLLFALSVMEEELPRQVDSLGDWPAD